MRSKLFATWVVLATSTFITLSTQSCITQWFDRDDPSGKGDYELLVDLLNLYPGKICPNPIGIEAQTVSGQPASQVFQVYNPTTGFSCVNANQGGGSCADYKVRFSCPEEWCSKCRTPWFDRDNPGGKGDYETLSLALIAYPLQVCAQPIAIEVTTISGTPVQLTGNNFEVFDPTQGFACVNELQQNGGCLDYRVRFTCPMSFCGPSCITQWFDRDDPSGKGDYELLADLLSLYPGEICPNPIGIEAQTVSGQPASQVFQVYNPTTGFSCVNANQGGGSCADYKVRFTCPEEWCSKCRTPWFDRDNPGGKGDYETLSLALIAYPLQVCAQPIAIEVTTISGTPVLPTGNNFEVYDPTQGFACANALQNGGCQDYRVRFTCPKSFCAPSCITKWFDRDDPSGKGDYELLADLLSLYPGEICPNPIGIEAQTVSGQPASQVFQVYNPTTGFSCVNANQGGGSCADYKVRFSCPEEWCSKCRTPWFDRDNPGGKGDYETLSLALIAYPLQVCAEPIAIEVTTISGTPVLPTGNNFEVFDPTQGFACANALQNGGCQDYRVRFTCPKSFCGPSCITQWFDRDDPNGKGDYELLADLLSLYPGEICPNPIGIEAQTVSGQPASQVFQVYNPTTGFSCVNANQEGGPCADYKVRFSCPEEWCSKCRTPWFDRDNPGGKGDYETLSLALIAYPLQVCAEPIAIEVTTISGTPVLPTGNNFEVFDPTQGFACVNALQNGGCQDYRVRFTCPKSFCAPSCITQWFDRDDPSGKGDYELLADLLSLYPGEICPNPIGIEAQTVSGQPASQVFQVYNPTTGFSCVNANQGGGSCADYKVRFSCPEEWCSKCRTSWFDRDNPGGKGDYETLSLALIAYPLQVCAQPIAIEVTTISGTPVLPTGNNFEVYDPTQGFACVNELQQNGGCQDYRVRFTCPMSFCGPKCVTRWFDSDNPNTNGGDSELLTALLSLYPGYICPNPLGIEAQTISGQPASQTGNVFQVYNPITGFSCVNANQGGGSCADYKVRFTCPEEWCSKCRTPWFDRDDPSGKGDYETLSLALIAYPLQVCAQPIAIEVTTISGTPVLPNGNTFPVYDPLQGFECVNGACEDYRVRFTCPKSFCGTKCVTRWFDSDDPKTNGSDSELLTALLSLYPGYICPNPLGIEAQTISGQPASQTGNVFQVYNPTTGFSCVNANQGGGSCADYKVRFTCPEEWCSKCRTPWFDRDNPGGKGDYETLSLALIAYPLQVCAEPIAIEVTTISGTPVLPNGNTFPVYDPLQGFECVNGACEDYRVRFTCPKSFCGTKCVTRWFDSDDPKTNGSDSELLTALLSLYPGYICPNPLGIEAQTISGQPASQTGNVFQVYNPTTGFSCVNANQGGGPCADYKVRFTCPEEWCSKCRTPWFDRDNPGGKGDYETLSLALIAYPLQVCAEPIAIEVTTISGTPVLPNGNTFPVYDPLLGFECVNGACQDYRVRFTCPTSFCGTKCVTRWFDSDDPKTNGSDSELLTALLSLYPGYICPNPLGIEAQTISGQPASQTGNVFQVYDATTGFSCVNANQEGGSCADYKVRFTCPEEWCSKCRTPWFDRDNPSGKGDYETLSLALIAYPLQVCAEPIAIEVTTISGTPVLPNGNTFPVYDPLQGFECVNGACEDYRVRFTCPTSFCGTQCVTRWFDSDNPKTNGSDSELLTALLSLYPGYICPNPLGIEAQTISGQPASQTGNVFQVYNPITGFSCVNANQAGGSCTDYKVRFTCPEEWCSKCRTPWFDRDNPEELGDDETLSLTLIAYPRQVCAEPIAIEVTTISGTPVLPNVNFLVYDPLLGFKCVNEPRQWSCQDYKVRYTCPTTDCRFISVLSFDIANMTKLLLTN